MELTQLLVKKIHLDAEYFILFSTLQQRSSNNHLKQQGSFYKNKTRLAIKHEMQTFQSKCKNKYSYLQIYLSAVIKYLYSITSQLCFSMLDRWASCLAACQRCDMRAGEEFGSEGVGGGL